MMKIEQDMELADAEDSKSSEPVKIFFRATTMLAFPKEVCIIVMAQIAISPRTKDRTVIH